MTETDETAAWAIEVRAIDEPKREALMVVCRYGETTDRLPRRERFITGAFTRSVGSRGHKVPFTTRHSGGTGELPRGSVVARPVAWDTAHPVELRAMLRFFDTPEGWAAFCRARDKELDGASVGFRAIEERAGDDGAREVTEAMLHHVMLCASRDGQMPAYDGPRLVEVRTPGPDLAEAERLLAVKWDPALAERGGDTLADTLARFGNAT